MPADGLTAEQRSMEIKRLLEPWADGLGLTYGELYCRSPLGQDLQAALDEAVDAGHVRREGDRHWWKKEPSVTPEMIAMLRADVVDWSDIAGLATSDAQRSEVARRSATYEAVLSVLEAHERTVEERDKFRGKLAEQCGKTLAAQYERGAARVELTALRERHERALRACSAIAESPNATTAAKQAASAIAAAFDAAEKAKVADG